jgi:glutamate synthase (NADPH/NADH) large chain
LIDIEDLPPAPYLPPASHEAVLRRQQVFGYTHEDLRLLLAPMATSGEEPLGSMGTDTSLAALSDRPRLLYDYFKQVFAQVTNPPLDAIREELVTAMGSTIGPEGNLLDPRPESCRQIKIDYPIIDNDQLAKLRHAYEPGFLSIRLPMLFDPRLGGRGLERATEALKQSASDAVAAGYTILILSDRDADRDRAPIPSLLATAAVHHHLVRRGARTRCALVVESGDAREVHHCALLLGYGAGAVNPYLAFETLDDMMRQGLLVGITHERAVVNYIHALNKGILKVMSKMGISTLQSYCGAQIFEAIGLDGTFVDRYFTWTASRIGGVGMDVIAEEVTRRHQRGFSWRFVFRGAARQPRVQTRRARPIWIGAASTSGAAKVSTTCSIRTPSSSCNTRREADSTRFSRNTPVSWTIRATAWRRCEVFSSSHQRQRPSRSMKSSRSTPSSNVSRPGRCRSARSARKRTRRSRSR